MSIQEFEFAPLLSPQSSSTRARTSSRTRPEAHVQSPLVGPRGSASGQRSSLTRGSVAARLSADAHALLYSLSFGLPSLLRRPRPSSVLRALSLLRLTPESNPTQIAVRSAHRTPAAGEQLPRRFTKTHSPAVPAASALCSFGCSGLLPVLATAALGCEAQPVPPGALDAPRSALPPVKLRLFDSSSLCS